MHIRLQKEFKEVAANSSRVRKSTNQESHIGRALLSRIKQSRCQAKSQKWREGNLERKLGAPDSISRNIKKTKEVSSEIGQSESEPRRFPADCTEEKKKSVIFITHSTTVGGKKAQLHSTPEDAENF